ncbi:MAG: iron ABC transporter substrate-binding protein [Chelatococcus sp.]|nr:MAG: iron ABC transporter substrate-binding protein [Chelatococcus sp.]
MISIKFSLRLALTAASVLVAGAAARAETISVYCGAEEEQCQVMAVGFKKAAGIDVAMIRKSSGEILAQIRAEARNPRADIWWAGTGDPHLQAAEEGLTEVYRSPMLDKLHPWARTQADQSGFRTVGIYANALGFLYNTELVDKKKLAPPACWADLIKPEFKDEVQMANPNSSGAAYTALATLVQLLGEEPAFDYLRKLNANINQYTKSGGAPASAASRGETTVGMSFLALGVIHVLNKFPVKVVAPCEGTGYEIGSMSLIKGAPNPKAAKAFYDWALTAPAQELSIEAKSYQAPSNRDAKMPPEAPNLDNVKLIDYDFRKFGSTQERKRLLTRWDAEIGSKR